MGRRLIFVVVVMCLFLVACDEDRTSEVETTDSLTRGTVDQETERTWLLPAGFDESENPGLPLEYGPNFWPANSTISLWRSGEDWILIHTQPKDAEIAFPSPGSWLTQVFESEAMTPAEGLTTGSGFGTDDVDGWLFASETVGPLLIDIIHLELAKDPQPDVMDPRMNVRDPALQAIADLSAEMDLEFGVETLDRVREFQLIDRQQISSKSNPRAVLLGSTVSVFALADPIPLDLLPIAVSEVLPAADHEIQVAEGEAFLVKDGLVHAVVSGGDPVIRLETATSLVKVDDLAWGEWAWPQFAQYPFLRLVDLDGEAPSDGGCAPTLDGSCYRDVTPEAGVIWNGIGPSVAQDADGLWTVTLPLDSIELSPDAEPGVRIGVVRQNRVLAEVDTSDLPVDVVTTTESRREALLLIKMLYPDEDLDSFS